MKLFLPAIVILLNLWNSYSKTYENFVLYNVIPTSMDQLRFLQNLERQRYLQVMFWKQPVKMNMDVQILVNPSENEIFLERALHYRLNAQVLIPNLQEAFNNQTIKNYTKLVDVNHYYWDYYHNVDDINHWLEDIAGRNKQVDLLNIGKSTEGREILGVHIKNKPTAATAIVEGGMHGNEWLPIAFVTYLINQLVHAESSGNAKLLYLSKKYNWLLIPIVNPDGYAYTMTEDRLWRKNRRQVAGSHGIDLDRNFDFFFGKFGSSGDPNSDFYSGPAPFSEIETKAFADLITANSQNLKFFFSYHSYGQKIIIPFSHSLQHIENYPEMFNYGRQAVSILRTNFGVRYDLGTYFDTLGHKVSGNSAGWVKSKFGTQYVYTFLLRDNGSYGYALPNSLIEPSCREALQTLVHIMTAKPKRFRSKYLLARPLNGAVLNFVSVYLVLACLMIKVLLW